jgi:hypothetical protein
VLSLVGSFARLLAHGSRYFIEAVRHAYDILIVIPLQIERLVKNGRGAVPARAGGRP